MHVCKLTTGPILVFGARVGVSHLGSDENEVPVGPPPRKMSDESVIDLRMQAADPADARARDRRQIIRFRCTTRCCIEECTYVRRVRQYLDLARHLILERLREHGG